MKKYFIIFSIVLALTFVLVGCSTGSPGSKTTKLVVGASPSPHAEILEQVKPLLKEKGIDLEIKEFNDYVVPNTALNDKQLDANFFQHIPYMEEFAKEHKMELVAVAKVHVEPLGAYSSKYKSIGEIPDGATVALPNDATNLGRALLLLQRQGLITLKDATSLSQTELDVALNPKNLKFEPMSAEMIAPALRDVDFAIINTNFALNAKLSPTKDSLFIEDKDSPYANVLTVRPDNKDSAAIKELVKALNSPEIKKFIEEKYQGEIVPAF